MRGRQGGGLFCLPLLSPKVAVKAEKMTWPFPAHSGNPICHQSSSPSEREKQCHLHKRMEITPFLLPGPPTHFKKRPAWEWGNAVFLYLFWVILYETKTLLLIIISSSSLQLCAWSSWPASQTHLGRPCCPSCWPQSWPSKLRVGVSPACALPVPLH